MITEKLKKVFDHKIKNLEPKYRKKISCHIINCPEYEIINNNIDKLTKFVRNYMGITKPLNSSKKEYWLIRGWKEEDVESKRLKISMKGKTGFCVETWLKHTNPNTGMLFTSEEALYQIKKNRKVNVEYWEKQGYSSEDAKIERQNFQKKQSSKNPNTHLRPSHINYWIKRGYTEIESIGLVKNNQDTLSLKSHIKRLGFPYGVYGYIKKSKNIIKTSLILDVLGSCDEENVFFDTLEKKEKEYRDSTFYASKESLLYFKAFYRALHKKFDVSIGYGRNKELKLYRDDGRFYRYDFAIQDKKLIIEFNGVGYHPNTQWSKIKWDAWKTPHTNICANEKQILDQKKIDIAKKNGYDILEIWGDNNKKINIKDIFVFLQKYDITFEMSDFSSFPLFKTCLMELQNEIC